MEQALDLLVLGGMKWVIHQVTVTPMQVLGSVETYFRAYTMKRNFGVSCPHIISWAPP